MNALFTGKGFTAAGPGGMLAGEATEWLFSPFNTTKLPDKALATVQVCLGVNGGRPDPALDKGCNNTQTSLP